MPVVTACGYVTSLLTGLTPPGATGIRGPISAMNVPPVPDVNADGIARIYVWPAHGPEKRISFPRNTGWGTPAATKQLVHDIEVFMTWMDSPGDRNLNVNFPKLIDYVMWILRTSPNPADYVDPETGENSRFVDLGENMTYDYVPPRTLEPDAWFRFDAKVLCTLTELFSA